MLNATRSLIIGTGLTKPTAKSNMTATTLMLSSLERALANAGVGLRDLDGIIAVPSLAEPRFMEAHYLATRMNLLPQKNFIAKTIDTGGAGPITGLLEADRMIRMQGRNLVAVVAGDAVSSLPTDEFLRRADAGCSSSHIGESISPVIPLGYDRVAQWQFRNKGVTREQLAMVSVLMSRQALRHPLAITRNPVTLEQVLSAKPIGPMTGLLECARRADGGASLIVASSDYLQHRITKGCNARLERRFHNSPYVLSGGEASGPLFPPPIIDEEMFSCDHAATTAFNNAGLSTKDIDFFGLYDCFPICFIRAVEAVGLAPKFEGGKLYSHIPSPGFVIYSQSNVLLNKYEYVKDFIYFKSSTVNIVLIFGQSDGHLIEYQSYLCFSKILSQYNPCPKVNEHPVDANNILTHSI